MPRDRARFDKHAIDARHFDAAVPLSPRQTLSSRGFSITFRSQKDAIALSH
jgi:hypothetical protein